jgi:hypothetical protein
MGHQGGSSQKSPLGDGCSSHEEREKTFLRSSPDACMMNVQAKHVILWSCGSGRFSPPPSVSMTSSSIETPYAISL